MFSRFLLQRDGFLRLRGDGRSVESEIGDEFLRGAAPSEDVSVKVFDSYSSPNQIRINGKDEISLKPANEEKTLWKTEVKVENIKGGNPKSRSKLIFKCIVLGGKLKKPIFINNPFPYKAPPKKAK